MACIGVDARDRRARLQHSNIRKPSTPPPTPATRATGKLAAESPAAVRLGLVEPASAAAALVVVPASSNKPTLVVLVVITRVVLLVVTGAGLVVVLVVMTGA